ncbi:MAG: response regulator transcription factor [Lachnospiraceae bacterium]|nr:response regulator transcription factor [Lachnospiraceae bacterium]
MGKRKVLVVDDESRMRKLVRDFLTKDGYEVLEAADGEAALDVFYEHPDIALILLDVMMPKLNGFEVLKEIRQTSQVPVLMLTAKGSEEDELQGFSLGVDEYITKPFSPKILTARVGAVIRRSHPETGEETIMDVGGILIDSHAHSVTVDGSQVILSVKEFDLLLFLAENRGMALSREQILNAVWNFDYFGDARTIDTHIKKLRSKLGSKGSYIKTIWGLGYKFEIEEG